MVHRPGEVVVENERYAVRLAEAAPGEADPVGFDELRRRGLVGMMHWCAPLWLPCGIGVVRTESVRTVTAIDVQDVPRDEPGFVRRDEHDAVGDLPGKAESTQRNLACEGCLVFGSARKAGQHASINGTGRDGIDANSRL